MFEQYNPSEQNSVQEENSHLQMKAKSGANWFYWIAGASLVNTIIFLFNGSLNLIVGLGIVQITNGAALVVEQQTGSTTTPRIGAFLVNLAISIIFVLIGYFAGKGLSWIFTVGVVLYALDAIIFLLFRDWLSIGFHAFALFFMIRGLMAANKLNKLQPPLNTV